eukprot:SM000001S04484  [mRNA]  locus=s1:429865:433832:- [translate_table: standard]
MYPSCPYFLFWQNNNIDFWRQFVSEYFSPGARKRWCVSSYGNDGRQPAGVFPQDVWHCELCGADPGRGFETTVEVLPRLFKIKYDSGIFEELLFVDVPTEYTLPLGGTVLEYGRAIQESVFEALRVVRTGKLRVKFSPDCKIVSWEFCTVKHEELFSRRTILQQVGQLASLANKFQNAVNPSISQLQNFCTTSSNLSRSLAATLDAPTVNELGFTKRYVRCLQISEVVNSMKDLIDFSQEHNIGPMASLEAYVRTSAGRPVLSSELGMLDDDQSASPLESSTSHLMPAALNTLATPPRQSPTSHGTLNNHLAAYRNQANGMQASVLQAGAGGSGLHNVQQLLGASGKLQLSSLASSLQDPGLMGANQLASLNALNSHLQATSSLPQGAGQSQEVQSAMHHLMQQMVAQQLSNGASNSSGNSILQGAGFGNLGNVLLSNGLAGGGGPVHQSPMLGRSLSPLGPLGNSSLLVNDLGLQRQNLQLDSSDMSSGSGALGGLGGSFAHLANVNNQKTP